MAKDNAGGIQAGSLANLSCLRVADLVRMEMRHAGLDASLGNGLGIRAWRVVFTENLLRILLAPTNLARLHFALALLPLLLAEGVHRISRREQEGLRIWLAIA